MAGTLHPRCPWSLLPAEYMVLPASQYSVLDAKRIERLDESTFRCYVGSLRLFSLEVEPVITVSVTVQERGPTVRLLSTKVRTGVAWRRVSQGARDFWQPRQAPRSLGAPRWPQPSCLAPSAATWCAIPCALQLRGSRAVEAANERFDATMTNVVRWQEGPDGGKQLASDTFLQVLRAHNVSCGRERRCLSPPFH